jgi:uncharacterized protein YjbI with pentapeptide repeats
MSEPPPVAPLTWNQWKAQHGHWAELLFFEWASEWIVHWSRSWEFVKVLELSGKLTLLVAAISWVLESGSREEARQDALKAKHYRAWELINSAQNSPGDAGRRDALLDLNKDHISLSGANLSKVFLPYISLPEVDLSRAKLVEVDFSGACLAKSKLKFANFNKASLVNSRLYEADLTGASLIEAQLNWAKLDGAILLNAKLDRANLRKATLRGVYLPKASLVGAILTEADLTNAEGLEQANLSGARFCRTTMPDGTLNSSDCADPDEATAPILPDLPGKEDCKLPNG